MKGKSLLVGILVVVLAAMCGSVWYLGNQQRLAAPSYGFFHEDGNLLVANFGNTLVWLDAYGRERKSLNLADLDIRLAGDYGFLAEADGRRDLLVYHRDFVPDLWFNLKRFLRIRESVETNPRGRDGFYRCVLAERQCQPFGQGIPRLDSSFRLAVDDRDGSVYLADTPAFKLFKLDGAGRVLAESKDGAFEFPNQIEVVAGELWVADTNRHRLVKVGTATDSFAAKRSEFPARLGGMHLFPHGLATDPAGERLWMIIAGNNMRAGRIAGFRFDGTSLGEATGDIGPEPLAIRYWRDVLWLADYDEPKMRRLSVDGNRLGNLADSESPTLARLADEARAQQAAGARLSRFGGYGFVLVLIAGFIAAWRLEKQQTLDVLAGADSPELDRMVAAPVAATPAKGILWITNTMAQRRKALVRVGYGLVAMVALTALALALSSTTALMPILRSVGLFAIQPVLIMWLFYWYVNQLSQQKLGVIGQSIVLERRDRKTVLPARKLRYHDSYLIADDVIVALGNPRQRVFAAGELERHVFPRLKEATRLRPGELYRHLWQAREPLFMLSLGAMVLVVLLLVAMRF